MRILVTGSNGQLGKTLHRLFDKENRENVVYTDVDTLDLTDKDALEFFFQKESFDIIINCAAYTAVDKAETNSVACSKVNVEAVNNIAEIARRLKIRVIHISTDYVFNGENHRPYEENDTPDPRSTYGHTKLTGEGILKSFCPSSIIIRTAWLYSEYGNNFLNTMLKLACERKEIKVVSDQIGTPTYAKDLAQLIIKIIDAEEWKPGVYHFTNEGVASWYDFAKAIFRISGNKNIKVIPILSKDYPTVAKRPHYSVLNKSKIKKTYGIEIAYWEDALAKCITKLENKDLKI